MGKPYYRTFLALPVVAGKDLLALRQTLMSALGGERISWVDPGRYHVTLRFLGDTPLSVVKQISSALKQGGPQTEASQIPVRGLGSFGPRKKPRVIWAGFGQQAWFGGLKAGVDALLEKQGIPKEDKPFTAHLTLGRVRSLRQVSRYHEVIDGMKTIACEPLWFNSVVYYRSILGSEGPEYVPMETWWFSQT